MEKTTQMVECKPGICSGAPKLRGRRITVYNLVSRLWHGDTLQDFVDDYPEFTKQDFMEALEYCKHQKCLEDKPDHFCDGCTYRRLHDGESFEEFLNSYGVVQTEDDEKIDVNKHGLIFLGTMKELADHWRGQDGWKMAEELINKYKHGQPPPTSKKG